MDNNWLGTGNSVSQRVSFGAKLEWPEIKASGVPNPSPENGLKLYESAARSPLALVPAPCPKNPDFPSSRSDNSLV